MASGLPQVSADRIRARFPVAFPLAGGSAALIVAALILVPLGAVTVTAGGLRAPSPADLEALWFTLWQAAVSAAVSCALAVPAARALNRRRFPGRTALVALMGAPFVLPSIVAVTALLTVFGRKGLVNEALGALGLPSVGIYGAHGVILAHVFFNLPLAVRMILHGWQAIPSERMRLAASLGFGPAEVARHLERPMLRQVLPGAFLAIFLVCLTSFAVALILGGGPRATTLELAIFQAFRYDADLGRAAALALGQVAVTLIALGLAAAVTAPPAFGAGLDRAGERLIPTGRARTAKDATVIALIAAFLLVPLATVLAGGAGQIPRLPASVWQATAVSLAVAAGSTVLTVALALTLATAGRKWAEAAGMLPMAVSSLVFGTGLFIVLRPLAPPAMLALPVTLIANALMSLPFALRVLLPEAKRLAADYDRLAASLGLRGWARLRFLTLPRLARPLGFAAGLAAAFSMGDLGVITLFSDGHQQTLPMAIYAMMGSYHQNLAAGAATVLTAITLGLFYGLDRIGRRSDDM
ncbi:thiamine/thiamine pyrophosphate ABC transporter permease ThiP [Paenirhodobacter enshiensis]|uniref:thiamine/thiamine pyrophosphate ABC transporter permease ThiP n=1 Tax=Paenirhodobacter enshiensis TaxID=1105367 RepID=UPI0035B05E6E